MNIGGMSFGRGILFTSGAYQVKASLDGKGNLQYQARQSKVNPRLERVSKIPFIRGLFSFGQSPIIVGLFLFTLLADFSGLFLDEAGSGWLDIANWVVLGILAAVIVVRLFFLRDMLQYHGAEHMAINTYEAGKELTVENIAAASRVHPRCGTIWAIYVVLLGIPCALFIPYVSVAFFITLSLSYELFLNAGRFRLLRWLPKLGMWLQKTLTTAVPERKHIEVAQQCLLKLISQSGQM